MILPVLALFNKKIESGVRGRHKTFDKLKNVLNPGDRTFWFHCASLGEYEQGLPVFEVLRRTFPTHKIVLSFFSPSGYEVRENSSIGDVVVYLPLDTPSNANRFLDLVNPELSIFVKYEFWPNLLQELKNRDGKTILISAVFRQDQSFFKWYGNFMRKALNAFDYIFTQDESSKNLLEKIDFKNVTVSGDTRFDRVSNQLHQNNSIDFIENFKEDNTCVVFGSTWPEDDKLYLNYINSQKNTGLKFIIAPHNIKKSYVSSLQNQLKVHSMCYSQMKTTQSTKDYNVFILDTIGYLSRVYSYANIAYVGGAAGKTGLHNILEPAVFGIPILIGKNHHKFPEAKTLINLGGVNVIRNAMEFDDTINKLITDKDRLRQQGQINGNYIAANKGAVDKIINYISSLAL